MKKRNLIGKSLSTCVGYILRGEVEEEQVLLITTNTRHDFEDTYELKRFYSDEAIEVMQRLFREGRLHQPRADTYTPNCVLERGKKSPPIVFDKNHLPGGVWFRLHDVNVEHNDSMQTVYE